MIQTLKRDKTSDRTLRHKLEYIFSTKRAIFWKNNRSKTEVKEYQCKSNVADKIEMNAKNQYGRKNCREYDAEIAWNDSFH